MKKTKNSNSRPVRQSYSHSHAIADEKKKRKCKESDVRLVERANCSDKEQLAKLDVGNWAAIQERERLQHKAKR